MAWLQLIIDSDPSRADGYCDWLEHKDAQAVTLTDGKDTPMYEPKPGEVLLWPDTRIVGLFDAAVNIDLLCKQLAESSIFNPQDKIKVEQLEDKDWIREWMDNFHPMQFGKRLWVCPSWRAVPDQNAVNIMLDPGLAFGTGTHPTTSLCLAWLDGIDVNNFTVVDFGCGSGILGVAALKLGASHCVGIDIDPQALIATNENAKRNGVGPQFDAYLPKNAPLLEADLVIANILSGPLLDLQQTIRNYCKIGGQLVLSGILAEQIPEIEAAYGEHFELVQSDVQGEWARVCAVRRD